MKHCPINFDLDYNIIWKIGGWTNCKIHYIDDVWIVLSRQSTDDDKTPEELNNIWPDYPDQLWVRLDEIKYMVCC